MIYSVLIAALCISATHASMMDAASQATIISLHTSTRAAKGLAALAWDESLATSASAYSEKCLTSHSGQTGLGENLAWGWASAEEAMSISTAIQGWVKEGPGGGHYEQMVLATNTRIGCGRKVCPNLNGHAITDVYVCHYASGAVVTPATTAPAATTAATAAAMPTVTTAPTPAASGAATPATAGPASPAPAGVATPAVPGAATPAAGGAVNTNGTQTGTIPPATQANIANPANSLPTNTSTATVAGKQIPVLGATGVAAVPTTNSKGAISIPLVTKDSLSATSAAATATSAGTAVLSSKSTTAASSFGTNDVVIAGFHANA